ncbi:MAG: UDP-N-acetylmuramoyl-tripeptide--D-alanyl-D-alanine ligase [Mycoplasmatota bacterium]
MKILDLTKASTGKLFNYKKNLYIKKISIDTRTLKKGDVFVCLKNNRDGHLYIKEAIKKKASLIILEDESFIDKKSVYFKVDDCYQFLLDYATYIRNKKINIPLIAVTGSVGKTTTKDLITHLLKSKYNILSNELSQNNHLGIPITLSKINNKHNLIVLEVGMNHLGEIEKLSKIVKPNTAVITNIGTSHIGNLGSQKNILKAKLEILKGNDDMDLLVNENDKYLKKLKSVKFDFLIQDLEYNLEKTSFNILYNDKKYLVNLSFPAVNIIDNISLAVKCALLYNIKIEDIINSLCTFKMNNSRLNIIKKDSNIIIDDSYNASLESMKGLFKIIKNENYRKIFILGDVLEQGKYSKKTHLKIKKELKKINNKEVLTVGDEFKKLKFNSFENIELLKEFLKCKNYQNVLFVIKGSHSMNLFEVVKFLTD